MTFPNTPDGFNLKAIEHIIRNALAEDIGDGDVTTLNTIPAGAVLTGDFLVKEEGVVAGLDIARLVFAQLDEGVRFMAHAVDGDRVQVRQVVATVEGSGRSLLTGERVALNFMQRMSGIATMTRRFVDAVQGYFWTRAVITERLPGLRLLDKWAVRLGGGKNHRIGLYDMVLIKDNHIAAVGGVTAAVHRVVAGDERHRPIEVEVQNLARLREALKQPIDRILLDNMTSRRWPKPFASPPDAFRWKRPAT